MNLFYDYYMIMGLHKLWWHHVLGALVTAAAAFMFMFYLTGNYELELQRLVD